MINRSMDPRREEAVVPFVYPVIKDDPDVVKQTKKKEMRETSWETNVRGEESDNTSTAFL